MASPAPPLLTAGNVATSSSVVFSSDSLYTFYTDGSLINLGTSDVSIGWVGFTDHVIIDQNIIMNHSEIETGDKNSVIRCMGSVGKRISKIIPIKIKVSFNFERQN
ncbi:hypothetical protein RirG_007230 [Rhizophagus irregularis DAOM 197198w]|uniref:Uncharacterized protein n=1 Tax=Rhizophagus irregularis (strain DAOM 197198w) TaxID=1432141 RepID=A0A015KBX2_RHIIW|nr:hypothetical protein RirG_007230 [Rhizophagus irregularis DAOM 197198w]